MKNKKQFYRISAYASLILSIFFLLLKIYTGRIKGQYQDAYMIAFAVFMVGYAILINKYEKEKKNENQPKQ